MKYVLGFILGTALGTTLALLALYYNPFAGTAATAPFAASDQPLLNVVYSAVPSEAIAFTNDGESSVPPHPAGVAELWEPAIRQTSVLVTLVSDGRGSPAGIGVKFSSASERTRVLASEALVDSVWHVYLPGRGTFLVDQTENLWSYLRDIVLPARWSSADSWRGSWFGITTAGPNALGTARVTGGSGQFADMAAEAVESWNARAYSAGQGPVSMSGNLTVILTRPAP